MRLWFDRSIGDAVLLVFPDPSPVLDAVCDLFARCAAADGFPVLRAGLHHGTVVDRDGDVFGATVNLAARIAGQASGGQCLATATVADAASAAGLSVVDLGEMTLRNIAEPVRVFQVELGFEPRGVTIDPVCRMQVDRRQAAGRLRHEGTDYWFCSLKCVSAFASSPDRYTGREA